MSVPISIKYAFIGNFNEISAPVKFEEYITEDTSEKYKDATEKIFNRFIKNHSDKITDRNVIKEKKEFYYFSIIPNNYFVLWWTIPNFSEVIAFDIINQINELKITTMKNPITGKITKEGTDNVKNLFDNYQGCTANERTLKKNEKKFINVYNFEELTLVEDKESSTEKLNSLEKEPDKKDLLINEDRNIKAKSKCSSYWKEITIFVVVLIVIIAIITLLLVWWWN